LIVVSLNITSFIVWKNFIKNKIMDKINSTDINSRIDTVVNSYIALNQQPLL
jgi:hypothetical protein